MALYRNKRDFSSDLVTGSNPYEVFSFDFRGKFVSTEQIYPSDLQGFVPVNVLSVLSSNSSIQFCIERMTGKSIASQAVRSIKEGRSGLVPTQVVVALMSERDYIVALTRKGTLDGVPFVQTLFVYNQDYDISTKADAFI